MKKSSGKNNKNNPVVDLKYHHQRSHNRKLLDENIIDLVRFLARRAAEEDYRQYLRASSVSPQNKGGT